MLYFTVPAMQYRELVKHYTKFRRQYEIGLNLLHSHLVLQNEHKELDTVVEKELFEAVLNYMLFYSVKCAIGENILKSNQLEYKSIVDLHFFEVDEVFVIEYNN